VYELRLKSNETTFSTHVVVGSSTY